MSKHLSFFIYLSINRNELKGFFLSADGELQRLLLDYLCGDVCSILAMYDTAYGLILFVLYADCVVIRCMDDNMVTKYQKKTYLRSTSISRVCSTSGRDLYISNGTDIEVLENTAEPSDNPVMRTLCITSQGIKVSSLRPDSIVIASMIKLDDMLFILTTSMYQLSKIITTSYTS
jgi:hypothetical protein